MRPALFLGGTLRVTLGSSVSGSSRPFFIFLATIPNGLIITTGLDRRQKASVKEAEAILKIAIVFRFWFHLPL